MRYLLVALIMGSVGCVIEVVKSNPRPRADIELAPTAVTRTAYGTSVSAIEAHLTYKARIVDGDGNTVKVAASTVSSKQSAVGHDSVSDCVASAVESMYEALAREL